MTAVYLRRIELTSKALGTTLPAKINMEVHGHTNTSLEHKSISAWPPRQRRQCGQWAVWRNGVSREHLLRYLSNKEARRDRRLVSCNDGQERWVRSWRRSQSPSGKRLYEQPPRLSTAGDGDGRFVSFPAVPWQPGRALATALECQRQEAKARAFWKLSAPPSAHGAVPLAGWRAITEIKQRRDQG